MTSSLPISNLLNQECYVSRFTGEYSLTGDEEHSEPVLYKCRIDKSVKQVYGRDGNTVSGIATVYLETDITDHDWIYLDAETETIEVADYFRYGTMGFNTATASQTATYQNLEYGFCRKPLQVNHMYDGNGVFSHCEVVI